MSSLNDQYHTVQRTTYATKKRGRSPSVEGVRNIDGWDNIGSRRYTTHRRVETDYRHSRNWDRKNDRPLNNSRRFDNDQSRHYQSYAKGWECNRRTSNNDSYRSERSVVGLGRFAEKDGGRSSRYHGDDNNPHYRNRSWGDNRREGSWSAWHSGNDYDDACTKHRCKNEIRESYCDGQRCSNHYEPFGPRSQLQRDRLSSWGTETDRSKAETTNSSHLLDSEVPHQRCYENGSIRIQPYTRRHDDNYDRSCSQQSWDRRRYGDSFEFDNSRSVRDDEHVSRSTLHSSVQQQLRDADVGNRECAKEKLSYECIGYGQDRARTRIQDNNSIVCVSDHESRRGEVDSFRNVASRENLISQKEESVQEIQEIFSEDSEEDGEIEESDIPRNRFISTVDIKIIDHNTIYLSNNDVNVVTETSEPSSSLRTELCTAVIDGCPRSDRCEDNLIVPPIVTSPDHPDSGSIMAVNLACNHSSSSVTASDFREKLNQSPLPTIVEIQHSSNAPVEDRSWKKVCDTTVPKSTGDKVLGPSNIEILQTHSLLNDVLSSKIGTGSTIKNVEAESKSSMHSWETTAVQPKFSVGNIPKKKRKVPIEDIELHPFSIPDKSCLQTVPKCDDSFRDKQRAKTISQNIINNIDSFKEVGNNDLRTEELDAFLRKKKKKTLRKFRDTIGKYPEEKSSASGPKRKSSPKSNCIDDDLMDSESDLEPATTFKSRRKINSGLFNLEDTKSNDNDAENCMKTTKSVIIIDDKVHHTDRRTMLQKENDVSHASLNMEEVNVETVSAPQSKTVKSRKISFPDCTDVSLVTRGSRVSIYWDGEDDYFDGIVTKIKPEKKRGFRIKYDDGDKDWVNLKIERFRLLSRVDPKDNTFKQEKLQPKIDITEVFHVEKEEKPFESSSAKVKSFSNVKSCLQQSATKCQPIVKEVSLTKASRSPVSNALKQQVKQEIKLNQGNGSINKPSSSSLNYLDRFKYQNNVERLKLIAKNNAKIYSTLNRGKNSNTESDKGDSKKVHTSFKPIKAGYTDHESTSTLSRKSIPKKLHQSNDEFCRDETAKASRFPKSAVTAQRKDKIKSIHKEQRKSAPEDSWVKEGLYNDSSDSETDDDEVMQWASKMFGVPVSPSTTVRGNNIPDNTFQAKFHPHKLCDETEEEIRRRKEEARPLTAAEIRAILKDDCSAEMSHWVRRSSRQPSKSALSSPKLKSLIEKLKSNDKDMVVLKMKKYCSDSATPTIVINTVLDALEENTNCEALYIQNYNLGMRDEQVLHLLRILQRPSCKIWCLNIGETYNVQTETWELFAEGLKDTNVTHMYASEHTITTELKDQIRNTIRNNRTKHNMHIDPNNIDTIVRCTHCWWNPFNAAVLRPYLKKKGYDIIFMDAEAQGLPGTMSEAKYLI